MSSRSTNYSAVYLVGAGSTGKTTIVNAIAEEFGDAFSNTRLHVIKEGARYIADVMGMSLQRIRESESFTRLFQRWLFEHRVGAEYNLLFSSADLLLSDRSILDVMCYSEMLLPDEVSVTDFQSLHPDPIVYIPAKILINVYRRRCKFILMDTPAEIEDDGFRVDDVEFSAAYTKLLKDTFDRLNIGYDLVPFYPRFEDKIKHVFRIFRSDVKETK
jgi:GTPase SAR1 family protein